MKKVLADFTYKTFDKSLSLRDDAARRPVVFPPRWRSLSLIAGLGLLGALALACGEEEVVIGPSRESDGR